MTAFLKKRWFLVALVVLIPLGIFWGMHWPTDAMDKLRKLPQFVTAFVLLLMAFSLDSKHLTAAVKSPGPVLWASLVNYGGIPLLGWVVSGWLYRDFQMGLMVAASVPCTLAAASVWTRKAQGNDAVSLMVTLLTNTICFFLTPLWLNLTTGQGVNLDMGDMMVRLVVVVLLPTLLGQVLRLQPKLAGFATKNKTPIGVVAQALILVLVLMAGYRSGVQLNQEGPHPSWAAVFAVWGACIFLHLAAMWVGWLGSGLFGFSRADRSAIVFASSQKTLPIGVLIATDASMLGNPELAIPFAVFPMLMYHTSQLFIDTVIADALAARAESEDSAPAPVEPTASLP